MNCQPENQQEVTYLEAARQYLEGKDIMSVDFAADWGFEDDYCQPVSEDGCEPDWIFTRCN